MDGYPYLCLSSNCTTCFRYESDQIRHMNAEDHWPECDTCTRQFGSWAACHQHMRDRNHYTPTYDCQSCNKEFGSQQAANQHMNATRHWRPQHECESCTLRFYTSQEKDQHMKQERHGQYVFYCKDCDKTFNNNSNLQSHLHSRIHVGTNIGCPFCKRGYATGSGLSHHLETGSCPNAAGLNRETIYRIIKERDPHGAITLKQIGWHTEDSSHFEATGSAFNGQYWVCYICQHGFRTRVGLNSHINSPVHKQSLYHCPNHGCGKQFVALAGLFGHLESESCGFMRFGAVQSKVGDVLSSNRLIAF